MIEYIIDVSMTGEATTSMMVSPWGQSASVLAAKLGLNKALTEALTGQISASIGSCEDFAPKNQRFDRLTNLIIKHWEFKHQIEDLRTKTGVSAKNHSFSLRIKSSDSSIQNQDFAGYNGWVEGFWRLVRIVDWYMGTCRTNTNQ